MTLTKVWVIFRLLSPPTSRKISYSLHARYVLDQEWKNVHSLNAVTTSSCYHTLILCEDSYMLHITISWLRSLRLCSAHCLHTLRQFTCEVWYHILRPYPYESNGTFALVVHISLDTSGEINHVAIDAGSTTIWREGSSTSALSPIPCVDCVLAAGVYLIESCREFLRYRPPLAMLESNFEDRNILLLLSVAHCAVV